MRFFLSLRRENSNGNGSGSASDGSTQPLVVRPKRRLWLILLLALLALTGLLANLFLLYTSIDQFVALLRQHCSRADAENDGSRRQQKQTNVNDDRLPRVRISNAEVRLVSSSFEMRGSKELQQTTTTSTFTKTTTKSTKSKQSSAGSRSKEKAADLSKIPKTASYQSSSTPPPFVQRTTLFIGKSPAKEAPPITLPRVRLTAADLARARTLATLAQSPAIKTTIDSKETSTLSSILGQRRRRNPLPTIVTALLDIGRDRWSQYGRTMHTYHKFMRHLLQLRVPMVIFTDEKSFDVVHRERARIGWGNQTRVRQISLSQLPLFVFQSQVSRIMRSELANWRADWDPAMISHPEASHPEYVILVNSKPFFLAEAATENPFDSEFFVWLDAGYGHGERSVFPAQWQWRPVFPSGKISVIKLTPPSDSTYRYGLMELYRQDISVFSGGFVAGDVQSVKWLNHAHARKFHELILRNKVDDDQTLLVLLANQYVSFFAVSHGDWFDAFELF